MTVYQTHESDVAFTRAQRFDLLSRHVNVAQSRGLEIGALSRPLVRRDDVSGPGAISYLDHLSQEDLKTKYADDPDTVADDIVPVDFVCPDGDLEVAAGGRRFDYVVAAHVIEHVPNLVRWFGMLEKILAPGGVIFLVVPDKRFTFDYARPVSTPGKYISAYLNDVRKPATADIFDHLALMSKTHGGEVWAGQYDDHNLKYNESPQNAYTTTKSAFDSSDYLDVHVGIFTPTSFSHILRNLTSIGLVQFEVVDFVQTAPNSNEFYAILRSRPEKKISKSEWEKRCLVSLPVLSQDSFQTHQNGMVNHLSTSIHEIATNYNNQEHRLNVLAAENESLFARYQNLLEANKTLTDKIGDLDDQTLFAYRHSRIVKLAYKASLFLQKYLRR